MVCTSITVWKKGQGNKRTQKIIKGEQENMKNKTVSIDIELSTAQTNLI